MWLLYDAIGLYNHINRIIGINLPPFHTTECEQEGQRYYNNTSGIRCNIM